MLATYLRRMRNETWRLGLRAPLVARNDNLNNVPRSNWLLADPLAALILASFENTCSLNRALRRPA